MSKDGRAILCANIVPLAVQGRRIVDCEEDLQNFLEGNDLRIERELDDFGVAGGALADLIVGRIRYETATISRHYFVYTFAFQINRLQTPETATTKSSKFLTILWARLQCFFVHKGSPLLLFFADKRTAQQNQPVLPPRRVLKKSIESVESSQASSLDSKEPIDASDFLCGKLMANRLPKALFLDLDDTLLADSDPADDCWLAVYQQFADQLADISYQKFLGAIHERRNWFWSDFERGRRGRLDLPTARRSIAADALQQLGIVDVPLAHEMECIYSEQREQRSHLFPEALEILHWLREQGLPLALLTNGAAKTQRKKIERWGLASFFNCIVVEGEFGTGKPDERVYLYALNRIGVQPEETWMIGDNLEWDVAAPQWLGIMGIWIDRTGAGVPHAHQVRPDRIIRTLTDLRNGR